MKIWIARLVCVASVLAMALIGNCPATASPIIQDGTFLRPIGTGGNLTPWSDWTNAGVTRSLAPVGIPGNFASLPMYSDLFQRFDGAPPGNYTLSFFARNESPWSAKLVISVQEPGGYGWYDFLQVIDLPVSPDFVAQSFTVNLTHPLGTLDEFYFSNSYDSTTSGAALYYPALQNSVNPSGTVLDVADVSLSPVPEPATLPLFASGLGLVGLLTVKTRKRKNAEKLLSTRPT